MNQYWKNHYNQNTENYQNSLYKQVGKTLNGVEINEEQLSYIVDDINKVLHFDLSDNLVDLCCGNGLITKKIGMLVKNVIGVDFSDGLIDTAKKLSGHENITYLVNDILQLPRTFFNPLSKVYMYEALQHFSVEMFSQLLSKFVSAEDNFNFFIGSIPDKDMLWTYYDTDEKKKFFLQREQENKPHMGRWWLKKEIELIAAEHGFRVTFYNQNKLLYTSYYRYNCLLEKR